MRGCVLYCVQLRELNAEPTERILSPTVMHRRVMLIFLPRKLSNLNK